MKNVGNNSRGRSQGVPKIFRAPMYRAHCAVIFAVAQLSCYKFLYQLFLFYNISVLPKKLFRFYIVSTKLFKPHFALTNSWLSAFNSPHLAVCMLQDHKCSAHFEWLVHSITGLQHSDVSIPQTEKIRGPQCTNYGGGSARSDAVSGCLVLVAELTVSV